MADKNMEAKITVEFDEATSRQQLNSGENISTLFGKIKKIFSDLKAVCFSGSYNDLSDTPDVVTKEYVDGEINGKLDKTTYEYNKTLSLDGSGKVCIGKFPCYDSNISVEIKSTTSIPYNGILVIATQNINTSGGGVFKAVVFGDENSILTNAIKIEFLSGSNVFSVYIDLPAWSKNILHIQCVNLKGTPTDIATVVSSIPSTATITPTNATVASAEKLTSSAGSSTVPVYFEDGKPKVCAYTLGSMCKESASDYEKAAVIAEKFAAVKNDIALNRTTLGMQCKNLLKNNAVSTSYSDVKFTVNSDGTVDVSSIKTSTATRFLVIGTLTLEPGNYVLTGADDLAGYGDIRVYVDSDVYQYNTPFTLSETKTVIVRICVYTNRTLPNTIRVYPMIRSTAISDSTYEPYQPSLKEQVPYSISLPSKSTSESYSYNDVPTMICLTPSESVSSGGGLYLINSVGTAVYLIDKTGIVINTDTTNKTFTITNNTASAYDVYISCAYKKE